MADAERELLEMQATVSALTELVEILLRNSKPALDEAYDNFDMDSFNPEADPQGPDSVRPIIYDAMQPPK